MWLVKYSPKGATFKGFVGMGSGHGCYLLVGDPVVVRQSRKKGQAESLLQLRQPLVKEHTITERPEPELESAAATPAAAW